MPDHSVDFLLTTEHAFSRSSFEVRKGEWWTFCTITGVRGGGADGRWCIPQGMRDCETPESRSAQVGKLFCSLGEHQRGLLSLADMIRARAESASISTLYQGDQEKGVKCLTQWPCRSKHFTGQEWSLESGHPLAKQSFVTQ
jgi:hypothetical protein